MLKRSLHDEDDDRVGKVGPSSELLLRLGDIEHLDISVISVGHFNFSFSSSIPMKNPLIFSLSLNTNYFDNVVLVRSRAVIRTYANELSCTTRF